MRELVRSRRRSGRPGLAMQALCGVLVVSVPAAVVYAQAPNGAAVPPPRPTGPADPWNSPDGAAPPPPAYGTDGYGAPAPGYPGGGMIQVDVKADAAGVRLEQVRAPGNTTVICTAPCSKLVPRNNLYVIDGDGIRGTSQFLLPDDRDQVTLTVQAGSSGRHGGGAALLIGGGILAYVGLLTAEVGLASTAVSDGTTEHKSNNVAAVGGVMFAAGVAGIVGGIYMLLTSSTKVTSSTGSTFSREEPRPRAKSSVALTPQGLTF